MEFPWSAFQQHGGKQFSAVRARLEKVLLQFEAHGHGGAHCNARCSPFAIPTQICKRGAVAPSTEAAILPKGTVFSLLLVY